MPLNKNSHNSQIELRGVNVHNLKDLDLDIPHHQLVVFCGVSGSGKTSIALDTLYAEGQRRYIESFSAYTRQFLDRLEKPAADRIEGIPAAVAVTRKSTSPNSRSTIGTATEIADYLRLLYAKIAQAYCLGCNRPLREHSPQTVSQQLDKLPTSCRYLVTFPTISHRLIFQDESLSEQIQQDGFIRVIAGENTINIGDDPLPDRPGQQQSCWSWLIVSRPARQVRNDCTIRSKQPFNAVRGKCYVLAENQDSPDRKIDGRDWQQSTFNQSLRCDDCDLDYPTAEPRLFSFNSPLGACSECEGFGSVVAIDMERVVPDTSKSLREGAIAPWNSPALSS